MRIFALSLLFNRCQAFPPVEVADFVGLGRQALVMDTVEVGRSVSNWPDLVVAPFLYTSPWTSFKFPPATVASGVKFWTLCFIQADSKGQPSWNGYDSIYNPFYKNFIGSIRAAGGDVIVSFGGAIAKEIAQTIYDDAALAAAYQRVIDTYKLRYIDIDIEGSAIHSARPSIDRRNRAMAILMKNNPGLRISYTLPCGTGGLVGEGIYVIESAKKFNAGLYMINLMTMDYYQRVQDMGRAAISAAMGTRKQLVDRGMGNIRIGITPMIGVNDSPGEVFGISDALNVAAWAKKTPYVGLLAFWEAARDTNVWGPLFSSSRIAQSKFQFHQIFKSAERGASSLPSGIANYGTCPSSSGVCADLAFSCCFQNSEASTLGNSCREILFL
jgi:Glycosyl hydrolases family 18